MCDHQVTCRDWEDNSRRISALIYHIYVISEGDWYPIYRGASSSVTSYLAIQESEGVVQLLVEIIDSADASTIALNASIHVRAPDPPPCDAPDPADREMCNMTRTEYISTKAQIQLHRLRMQHNPKALLQYMIAVNLQLNAESSSVEGDTGGSVEDAMEREAVSPEISLRLAVKAKHYNLILFM